MKILKLVVLLFTMVSTQTWAQQKPYWTEIQEFKKQDSIQFPPQKAILFVGSSSFRMWNSVQQDFPGYTIINRGFGGSTLSDVMLYANDIIIAYKPKQVVIYCGENDLASAGEVTAEIVTERFIDLFTAIRDKMKKVNIVFVSIKPSPSRSQLMPAMALANKQIEAFLKIQKRTAFVNVYDRMLTAEGHPRTELFIDDMLHMNAEGYAIWREAILPYLKK
ncbi:MAG: hypothetical protein JNM57_06590 [Cyclobacteriaceae bacterium]|nr:hypothetical protein [Cyclobacteriaceae bacterium]